MAASGAADLAQPHVRLRAAGRPLCRRALPAASRAAAASRTRTRSRTAAAAPRLGVYLADTLARAGRRRARRAARLRRRRASATSGVEANRIKTEQPILAIIGNPPYRRLEEGENETLVGRWMDELWDDLKAAGA